MKMIDMKMSNKKGSRGLEVAMSSGESYPYGLELSLDKESIKKLGLKAEDLVAGAEIDFCINAKVTSTRIGAGEKDISNAQMQIMKMCEMPEGDDA